MIPAYIKPQKQIVVVTSNISGTDYWPEPIDSEDTTWVGGSSPTFYKWSLRLDVSAPQNHGYPYSTTPYLYNGLDINKNGFIASSNSGRVYRISEVTTKTTTGLTVVVEDVYRTLSFTNPVGSSISPSEGRYMYFEVDDDFEVKFNPFTLSGVVDSMAYAFIKDYLKRISFTQYPILSGVSPVEEGDIIAVDESKNFVKASEQYYEKIVGRVLMSTGIEGEYVIEPVTEFKEFESGLGNIGDILYLTEDGNDLTTDQTMKPMYLKVKDAEPNISLSNANVSSPYIRAGSEVNINGVIFSFSVDTDMDTFVNDFNNRSIPNMDAETVQPPFGVTNGTTYTHGIMGIMDLPSVITINGSEVTISTTTAGQAQYGTDVAIGPDIVTDIMAANVPDIEASFNANDGLLTLTNTAGGDIMIVNVSGGIFASDDGTSGTGLPETNIAPTDVSLVQITHQLGKEILIRDIGNGLFTSDSGISSSDNGALPMGIYYGGRIRTSTNYVVNTMDDVSAINPYIGDGIHVLDSGNGEWVEMKYTSNGWVTIATQDSARTDADTMSVTILSSDSGVVNVGTVSPNSRITNVSVVVNTPFDDSGMTIDIGDSDKNDRLISDQYIDLLNTATYSNSPSHIYGSETDINVYLGNHSSTMGELTVVISYQ